MANLNIDNFYMAGIDWIAQSKDKDLSKALTKGKWWHSSRTFISFNKNIGWEFLDLNRIQRIKRFLFGAYKNTHRKVIENEIRQFNIEISSESLFLNFRQTLLSIHNTFLTKLKNLVDEVWSKAQKDGEKSDLYKLLDKHDIGIIFIKKEKEQGSELLFKTPFFAKGVVKRVSHIFNIAHLFPNHDKKEKGEERVFLEPLPDKNPDAGKGTVPPPIHRRTSSVELNESPLADDEDDEPDFMKFYDNDEADKDKKASTPTKKLYFQAESLNAEIEKFEKFGKCERLIKVHRVVDLGDGIKGMIQECAGFRVEVLKESITKSKKEGILTKIRNLFSFKMTKTQKVNIDDFGSLERFYKDNRLQKEGKDLVRTLLLDSFKAIKTVHDNKAIFVDLKFDNILVTENGRGKVGDLGSVRNLDHTFKSGTNAAIEFASPELICDAPVDQKSDIWACGMMLYQIYNKKEVSEHPIYRDTDGKSILITHKYDKVTTLQKRISHLQKNPSEYLQAYPKPQDPVEALIWQATRLDPKERPSIDEFISEFEKLGIRVIS